MKTKLLSIILFGLAAASMAAGKPNIVLILADDVSADMFSCYGRPGTARTPNIDRIAREGVQFNTCFAPAICGPSRALLMTGVYANHTGAYRNDIWLDGAKKKLFEKHPSWARLMRESGYKTAAAGKWHVSAEPWEEVVGFDEYCIYEGPDKIKGHFGIDVIADGRREDIKLPDVRYWYSPLLHHPRCRRADGYRAEEARLLRHEQGREGKGHCRAREKTKRTLRQPDSIHGQARRQADDPRRRAGHL
jgi:arylsulfatase A-like enzyme